MFNEWRDRLEREDPETRKRYRDLILTQPTPPLDEPCDFFVDTVALDLGLIPVSKTHWIETEYGDYEIKNPASPTIFAELVKIGRENKLKPDGVGWAKGKVMELVRRNCPEWVPASYVNEHGRLWRHAEKAGGAAYRKLAQSAEGTEVPEGRGRAREREDDDEDDDAKAKTQQELIDWLTTLPANRTVSRERTMKILGRSERTLRYYVSKRLFIQIGDRFTAGSIQKLLKKG